MGSYGIGPSRLMGLLAEHLSDDKGLVWPVNVAPAVLYIARLGDSSEVIAQAETLYEELEAKGIRALYDDRAVRPGQKFADADLMGIPYRVVISEKTVAAGMYEFKARIETEAKHVSHDELLKTLDITG